MTRKIQTHLNSLITAARSFIATKKYKEAYETIVKILEISPQNQQGIELAALLKRIVKQNIITAKQYLEDGNGEEVVKILKDVKYSESEVDIEYVDKLVHEAFSLINEVKRANILLDHSTPDEALNLLEELVKKYPQNSQFVELRDQALKINSIQRKIQGPTSFQYITASSFIFISIIFFLRWIGLL